MSTRHRFILFAIVFFLFCILIPSSNAAPRPASELQFYDSPEQEEQELASRGIPAYGLTIEERREMADLTARKEQKMLKPEELDRLAQLIDQSTEPPAAPVGGNIITAGTYAFSASTGAALEDMSSGTTALVGPNVDDTASVIADIGFDFWFDGVRYRHFSANANGLMRLGTAVVGTTYVNDLASTTNVPQIAPYWDDLYNSVTGKTHFKVVGTAPNRKLVVEWTGEEIPRVGSGNPGAGTFQAWLHETTGVIEFVYGNGIAVDTGYGYSVGFGSSATSFASVTTAGPTVAYGVANNTQTTAIAAGTKYTFTPNIPLAPTGLTFSGVSTTGMTLNWTDNSSNEVGYAIYRSVNGGSTWDFITQTAADVASSVQTGLNTATNYTWAVYAVTEGGVSDVVSGSQSTTAGTMGGTYSIGPTGAYPSLTAAFAAIAGSGIAAPVVLELQAAYLSSVETFPVAIGNAVTSATHGVTIRPETGATGLLITSGDTNATIDLNGASGVVIDGRPGGAGTSIELTIANTANAPALRFINDAIGNMVEYVNLQGVNNSATSGVVLFSTTTGVLGNDNNVIMNCNIGDGATTPANLVYSAGSASAAAQFNSANSGDVIVNSNLFNFFHAAAVSQGINLQAGNTNWTIVGNSFYQTAARTATTGALHSAILINTTTPNVNEGTVIANNYIGGSAPNAGGSAWTLGGTTTNRFVGINLNAVGATPTIVAANTVRNFSLSTTYSTTTAPGMWAGIYLGAGFASITGNTIGDSSSTGSITTTTTVTGSTAYGIASAGTSGAEILGNTIGSINLVGGATISASFIGIQGVGTGQYFQLTGNTIGSTSVANSINAVSSSTSTTGQAVTGALSTGSSCQVTGNTVANLNNNYAGTATAGQIRGIVSNSGVAVMTSNTVRNLTTTSLSTGTTTSASALGIVQSSATSGQNVSQNTVHSLYNTAATPTAVGVIGIYYTAGTTAGVANLVSRNFVHSLALASTGGTSYIYGLYIAAGLSSFQNNMVRLGIDPAGVDIATGNDIRGIYEATGTDTFYFNSVYIGGSGVSAGATNTYALYSGATTNVRAFQDNILVNVRSNGLATGRHVAALYSGTLPNPTGLTSNYNIYFANGVGYALLQNGTNYYATLADWRAAAGSLDANSIAPAGMPVIGYANPTGTSSTVDLHLTGATVAEQSGLAIAGVTVDFDGEDRATLSPTDIGADAGNFGLIDVVGPTIVYTPLASTVETANRAFGGVSITDPSGVNASPGTNPRVYFKRSTDANAWNDNTNATDGWKYAEANGGTSPFDFTINYSLLYGGTGVTVGTIVQYFVVAQDLAFTPNVSINAGTFASPATSVALTAANFPISGTINSYLIQTTYAGTYTVPGSFASLTNPGGAFDTLNVNVLTGDVTLEITTDLTGESGVVPLNQWSELGAGGYNLLIKPTGAPRAITGTGTGSVVIKINGADRVTIDGSLAAGTDRSLTISNPNAATGTVALWIGSLGPGAGATNDTIKNCIISAGSIGSSSVTTFGIFVGSTTGAAAGPDNDNLTIQNNLVRNAFYALQAVGVATTAPLDGLVIADNTFGDDVPANSLGRFGILVEQSNGTIIAHNIVKNVGASLSSAVYGIYTGPGTPGSQITRNLVTGIYNSSTSGWAARGIYVNTGLSSSGVTVANNMVSDITSYSDAVSSFAYSPVGIMVEGSTGGVNIYHNSVDLFGSHPGLSGGTYQGCLFVGSTTTALDIRDNTLSISYDNSSSTTDKSYAVYSAAAATAYTLINNNDYYATGAAGVLGYLGSDRTTLAAWQAATGQDAQSIAADPLFLASTDLHISCQSPTVGAGAPIAAVTVDFDGEPRSATTPDIGADEIAKMSMSPATLPDGTVGVAYSQTITASGGTPPYTYTVTSGALPGGLTLGNSTGVLDGTPTTAGTFNFTITVTDSAGCPAHIAYTINIACGTITVSPATLPDGALNIPYSQSVSATGGAAPYTFEVTAGALPAGLNLNSSTGEISGTPTTLETANFTITATDAQSCTGSRAYAITIICPAITLSPATLPNGTVGTAYSQTVTAAGGLAPYAYIVSSGALPTGLVLNGTNGAITGTPTAAGTFNFTVTATDAGGCTGSQAYSVVISCPTITLSPSTLPNGIVGTAYSQTISASGGASPYTFGVTAGSLPSGLSLNAATGAITGTPTAAGTFDFTVTATDSYNCTGARAYSITISNCPTITLSPATLPNGTTGTAYDQTVSASGGVAPYTFAVTAGSLPTGLALSSAGAITGTPTETGTFDFTVTATDSNGCPGSHAYSIDIGCPAITLSPATLPNGIVGTAYSQTVSASGGTAPYTYAVTGGALPTGLSLDGGTGGITGTPTAAGSYGFTITATDAHGCIGSKVYSITATCPAITVSPATLPAGVLGTAYSQTISASGGTSPYNFAVTAGSLPTGLSLNATTGAITGIPTASGSFSFTITATDNYGCTGSRAYMVLMACPTITLTPATLPGGTVGTAYNQTVSASGGNSPYTFAVLTGSLPDGLTLDANTGVISGTPTTVGVFNFTIGATDAYDCAGTRVYSISIAAACPTITLSPDTLPNGTTGAAYAQTITASGGSSPYTFAVTSGNLPAGLTLATDGSLTGTPSAEGSFNFDVTATDNAGCTGLHSYSITITCATITLSPATLPDGVVGAAYSAAITTSGGVAPYTYAVIGSLPAGLTLDISTGAISGTPTTGGTFNFQISATDANACTGVAGYSIVITTCLFCDDFEDGQLAPSWIQIKPAWTEANGVLTGTPTGRKATITNSFAGCENCYVESQATIAANLYSKVWMYGWYHDKRNTMELLINEGSDKIILKQRVDGRIIAKNKGAVPITPGVPVTVRVAFDGTQFVVSANGTQLFTLHPVVSWMSPGTVGFGVKNTTASFGYITVNN